MITISLWEIDVILWFQSLGDWLKPVMLFFTQLGHPAAYLLIISFLYWGVDSKLGQRIAVFTLFSGITNVIIKWLFHVPRPYWVDARIRPIGNASTAFGFPSGHAQTSLAWTMIGRGSFKWRGRAVLFAGIVLIGISRVYLGVHSPFQVLIGWLLGILLMIAYWRLERPAVHWLTSKPFPLQIFVVSIITVFILLLGWFSAWLLRDWTIPRLWMQNVMPYLNEGELFNPLDFDDVVIFAAGFSGMALGMILMTPGRRIIRRAANWRRGV